MKEESTLTKLERKEEALLNELMEVRNAIRVIKRYIPKYTSNQDYPINITNEKYDKEWTITEKLIYVLKLLGGKGTMKEVATKLEAIDDSYSKDRVIKFSSVKLSQLFKEGKIDAIKEGRKHVYLLKIK